jgi:hypothetical protein
MRRKRGMYVEVCGACLLHGGLQLRSNRVLMRCEAESESGDSPKAHGLHLKLRDNVADYGVRHVVGNVISVGKSENQVQPRYFDLIRPKVTGNGI